MKLNYVTGRGLGYGASVSWPEGWPGLPRSPRLRTLAARRRR